MGGENRKERDNVEDRLRGDETLRCGIEWLRGYELDSAEP
jgi:hypothetical protein